MTRTVRSPTDHVVVVGAGLAGLATALHLLGAGRRVTVVERDPTPGGRAGRLDLAHGEGSFRLDTGPTVITMPELIEEALAAVGEKIGDRLEMVDLHPAYHARFADGSAIDVHTDPGAMEQEIREKVSAADAEGYRRLRAWLTELYRVQMATFIDANFDSPLDVLSPDLARLGALGGFGRLGPRIGKYLHDERLRRIFSFQALYAGVPPARALAAYAVIAYMDTIAGVSFPMGGVRALPQALADAAADAGAEFRYGTTVTGLERAGGRVRGLRTVATDDPTADGDRLDADAVVLSCDLPAAYALIGRTPRRAVPTRWSPSAYVWHAGVPAGTGLGHHTISFGDAWASTFDEIITEGRLMSDPSLLVTHPTATDPSLAPAGHELVSVLAPSPNTEVAPMDWARIGPRYRDELRAVLAGRGIELGEPVAEHVITPDDWSALGLAAGTPFSAAHTFSQTGPFRAGNLVRGEGNVVLAGCGTTPGVGVPTVLVSGKLAAARITG
ncbi:phytoene desaturase family protein [Actinomycetospora lemnae]|uniref:Phytoene desaturase family protein n=1 Tax=Actinomycetospora lemnae TaxID=3019891 RepID=A0ABT5T1M9_9PSEU|nr:phytoene desaturase family protein [Actinomycetospora sp. DW7H6]MDD7968147.1 phytoene desaturase family protein [Actinomycetospora sp. DW7H6]